MSRLLVLPLLLVIAFSCDDKTSRGVYSSPSAVIILPFVGMDTATVREIQKGLSEKIDIPVITGSEVMLPPFAYYAPRKRYVADSLLLFLKKYSNNRFEKVIGITACDISTRKKPYKNYGIMGYGYCPGAACVISSFRIKRSSRDINHFNKRMVTLALHELGHTYALPHCKSAVCIMRDAQGKMHLDDNTAYCSNCYLHLKRRAVVK